MHVGEARKSNSSPGIIPVQPAQSSTGSDIFWNHPNFNIPTFTDIGSPGFGAIPPTTGTPRLIRFTVKISF